MIQVCFGQLVCGRHRSVSVYLYKLAKHNFNPLRLRDIEYPQFMGEDKTTFEERRGSVWFVGAVSFTVLLAIAGAFVIVASYNQEIDFDRKSWITDKPYGDRVRMARRLVRTGALLGKPEAEVSKYLALPEVAHVEQMPTQTLNKEQTMYEINVSTPGRFRELYIYASEGKITGANLPSELKYVPKDAKSK